MQKTNDITLYGLTEELTALDELLELDSGEITEEYESLVERVDLLLTGKTDNVVGYVKKEEDLIKLAAEKIKELQVFKKAKENKIQRFKDYVGDCINRTGQDKFVGTINSIKLRKPSKVLKILDEDKIPLEYLETTTITTTSVDNKKLKDDLKHVEVEGAILEDGKISIIVGLNKGSK